MSNDKPMRGSHLQDIKSTVNTAVKMAQIAAESLGDEFSEITVAYQGISITMKPKQKSDRPSEVGEA